MALKAPTSLVSSHVESRVSIHPNPFSTRLLVHADHYLSDASLKVYNCLGQQVRESRNNFGRTITFYRDDLASGSYFIQLAEHDKVIKAAVIMIAE